MSPVLASMLASLAMTVPAVAPRPALTVTDPFSALRVPSMSARSDASTRMLSVVASTVVFLPAATLPVAVWMVTSVPLMVLSPSMLMLPMPASSVISFAAVTPFGALMFMSPVAASMLMAPVSLVTPRLTARLRPALMVTSSAAKTLPLASTSLVAVMVAVPPSAVMSPSRMASLPALTSTFVAESRCMSLATLTLWPAFRIRSPLVVVTLAFTDASPSSALMMASEALMSPLAVALFFAMIRTESPAVRLPVVASRTATTSAESSASRAPSTRASLPATTET